MLRLSNRKTLGVVADQFGNPTSAKSIANVLYALCLQYHQEKTLTWGTYHFTGIPQTNWHAFAIRIFAQAKTANLLQHEVTVNAITTEQYPTKAPRPKNSTLCSDKISTTLHLPPTQWEQDLIEVVQQIKHSLEQ